MKTFLDWWTFSMCVIIVLGLLIGPFLGRHR